MRLLIFSDPHLTDNPLEEYRWTFLEQKLPALIAEHRIDTVWCLGDVVDRKDRHSGELVNRLVSAVLALQTPLNILMGNHDGPNADNPAYWSFLSTLPNVKYITE